MRRPQNFKKVSHLFWQTSVSLSSVKTGGIFFFEFFVTFSEKLDFTVKVKSTMYDIFCLHRKEKGKRIKSRAVVNSICTFHVLFLALTHKYIRFDWFLLALTYVSCFTFSEVTTSLGEKMRFVLRQLWF